MIKRRVFYILISIVLFNFLFISCTNKINYSPNVNREYKISNINIYKDTPVWDLALAVKNQNIKTIENIAKKQPQALNYQDARYGATLLLWAIGMENYESAEALLKSGADPNLASVTEGETPLFLAAGYSWIDNEAKKDPKYVKLLLQYGADPNKNYIGSEHTVIEPGASPLMNSIGCGIEKTKALVEAGADINYKTNKGKTAAIVALQSDWIPEYAHYLIVEKKAKVSEPYFRRKSYGNEDPNEKLYPVDLLKYWDFEVGSKGYKMKLEIIDEFKRQGVTY